MASLSRQDVRIDIVEEVTPGTTPDAANLLQMRYESDQFGANANQVLDPTITTDRIAAASQRVGLENRGSIGCVMREDDANELLLECAMGDDFVGDQLNIGSTLKTITVVNSIGAGGTLPNRYTGVVVNGFTLSIPESDLIKIVWDLQGGPAPVSTDAPAVPVYSAPAPAGTIGMLSTDAVLSFSGGLTGINSYCINTLELRYTNNAEGVKCIGTEGEVETQLGQASIEMSARVLFEDNTIFNAYLNQTNFGITVTCNDPAGSENYAFTGATDTCHVKQYSRPNEGNSGSIAADLVWDLTGGSAGTGLAISRS